MATTMFIGRMDILLIERGEFGVLAGSYMMGELLEFGGVLPAEDTHESCASCRVST